METEQTIDTNKPNVIIKTLKMIGSGLAGTGRIALIAAMVLLAVWCVGRIVEAVNKTTVFDPDLIYWVGVSVWVLLSVWVVGYVIGSARDFGSSHRKVVAAVAWVFFLVLVSAIVVSFEGFRVSSAGLFATVGGSAESSNQASFLLFKFHPANPMLAINLLASKVKGMVPDMESLASFVWGWNVIFAFFVWSLVYGIVLLIQRDKIGAKTFHLFLAACGLTVLIMMKAVSTATKEQMIFFQAAAVILFVFQVLLTYSIVRGIAARRDEIPEETSAFIVSSAVVDGPPARPRVFGLPPSGVRFALFIFIMLPILADLQNQFQLAPPSAQIMKEIANNQTAVGSEVVTVTPISVRSGPAIGDDVVAVLPKGTQVPVVDKKCEWVSIGQNKWVAEKFLRPVEKVSETAVTLKSGGSRPAS
jgi:hypothetical protein